MSDYNLTRIKDLEQTASEVLDDDFFVIDGATGGVRKIAKGTVLAAMGEAVNPLAIQTFLRRDAVTAPADEGGPVSGGADVLEVQVFS